MKNEIGGRCFDNNLQKMFRANILEDSAIQILLIAAFMNG